MSQHLGLCMAHMVKQGGTLNNKARRQSFKIVKKESGRNAGWEEKRKI